MNKAVVFDLDGTLIDSLGDIAAALNRLFKEENLPELSLDQVQSLVGGGVSILLRTAWDQAGLSLSAPDLERLTKRFLGLYLEAAALKTIVFDGVPETLKALRAKGWRIGICTNKPDIITQRVLDDLGLSPLVDAVVGGDFPRRKPDGEHVLETLRRLNADPKKSLYVGDSATDIIAAKAAGVPVACVAFGYAHSPVADLGADWVIENFNDPDLLDILLTTL